MLSVLKVQFYSRQDGGKKINAIVTTFFQCTEEASYLDTPSLSNVLPRQTWLESVGVIIYKIKFSLKRYF